MKKFVGYLLYILFFCLIIFLGVKYGEELKNTFKYSKSINSYLLMFYDTFFHTIIGILIGLPGFAKNFNKAGIWRVDRVKLFIIGLPTFFVSIINFIYFSRIAEFVNPIVTSGFINSEVITISGIIFGFTLLSSIEKVDLK